MKTEALGTECSEFKALGDHLSTLRPGPISDNAILESLLARCWGQLSISRGGGMRPDKLYDRVESCVWDPPALSFTIERHGGLMCGSSRAELQNWTIDVNKRTAEYSVGCRKVRDTQPRLDTETLAVQIAERILQRRPDPRLKCYPNGRVEVRMGEVLPEPLSAKQTREGRRRRFRERLDSILLRCGWKKRGRIYEPPSSEAL